MERTNSELDSLSWRRAWPHLLVVFTGVLCLYAATMPRSVALEDDGSFIMAARFLGIAHPPGYPLWVLLAKPFTWIPIGSVAFRVHFASGVFGAAACAVLWWIARRLTHASALAYFAAGAFAVSDVMWSQSIIADVYSLNVLFFFILLAQILGYCEEPSRKRFMGIGLVYGLSLSNHWPLMILATPGLLLLLWPQRRRLLRDSLAAAPAVALGLAPYLWMVLRSNADPETSFLGPIRSLREALSFLLRRVYSHSHANVSATVVDKLYFGFFYLREWMAQFTPVGFALAVAGAVFSWQTQRASWSLGLLAIFLGGSFLLVPTFPYDYDYLERLVVRVYPVIAYGVTAIWLCQGLRGFGRLLRTRVPRAADALTATLALGLVGALLVSNLAVNDRSQYRLAEAYGTALLESLAPDAILFTGHDFNTFPLGYLNLIEGVRPDVDLYHPEALVFSNRLYHPRADRTTKARALHDFLIRSERPIYAIDRIPGPYAWEGFGFYSRLDARGRPGQLRYTLREDLLESAQQMLQESEISDGWSLALARTTTGAFSANLYAVAHDAGVSDAIRSLAEQYAREFRTGYYGLVGQIGAAESLGGTALDEVLEWANAAEVMLDESIGRRHRAGLFAVKGKILVQLGRDDEAIVLFERAVSLSPQRQNAAIVPLMRLHALAGRRDEYLALRDRYFSNQIGSAELIELDQILERRRPLRGPALVDELR